MDPKTLEALKGSIAKWEAIVAGTGEDLGWKNCPLCALFFEDDCEGCPVAIRTGEDGCDGTPYQDYWEASTPNWVRGTPDETAMQAAAEAEVKFLKSLLPAGESQ